MSRAKKRLGKGLDALLPPSLAGPGADDAVRHLPLAAIKPNPQQPRQNFDQAGLEELAQSIKVHGLVQPVLVTPGVTPAEYFLVAGERRWRAAGLAGLTEIPALVRDLDEVQQAALALIENLQREDLTPLEEAQAYQALQAAHNLTQAEIAAQVGKSRSQVANTLRLLQLDPAVQKLVGTGQLSRGHAKVLLSVADPVAQKDLAYRAIENDLSVRELENTLQQLVGGKAKGGASQRAPSRSQPDPEPVDAQKAVLTDSLERALGSPVTLQFPRGRKSGRIVIEFFGDEDLERLFELLTAEQNANG